MKEIKATLINAVLLVFLSVIPVSAFSLGSDGVMQTVTVTGLVVDANNEPLIGVSVAGVGSNAGAITNMDGKFTVQLPANKMTLKFSYVGFAMQTISVKGKSTVKVVLHEDLQQLDEVVVVGYGVQQKSHLTGGITKVDTEGLEDTPTARLDQALMGKAAGVQILNLTSEVGSEPDIMVRGTSSFSASSTPLIVVDGYPMADGIDAINPSDVQSIEILKDAASAAIYGSQAANGVIMITTKSGSANKPKYSLRLKWGKKDNYKLHPIMGTKDFINYRLEDFKLTGGVLGNADIAKYILAQHNEVNWQEQAFQNAQYMSVDFSVSGGSKGIRYYLSGAYTGDDGMMMHNHYDRYNVRARIDAELSKRVSVGINIAPTYTSTEKPGTNYGGFVETPWWIPIQHDAYTSAITGVPVGEYTRPDQFNNGVYEGINPQTGEEVRITASPNNSSNNNPVGIMNNITSLQENYRVQVQGYIDINLWEGLKFRSSNSYNFSNNESMDHRNEGARNVTDTNRGMWSYNRTTRWSTENTLSYNKTFKQVHAIDLLAGMSAYKNMASKAGILGFDFQSDDIFSLSAAGRIDQYEGTSIRTGTWKSEDSMLSYYGRVNYALKDRYLFSATYRIDGSSKFGKDNRWGAFPSVSAGWRISEEPFVRDHVSWLDQLKFRISYGVTGTSSIVNHANTDLLDPANYVLGSGNGSVASGLANNSSCLGSNTLQWEQTGSFNIGLDLAVLNNRIGLTFDYFYATTKSLLYQKTINSIVGYNQAWTNEGKLRNRGFEVELTTYNFNSKKFKWNTSFNLSLVRNRLLSLSGPAEQITKGSGNEYYIARVGEPLIQFYGFKTIGIWHTQEEINNNPHHIMDTRPGGLRVQNTNCDDVINDDDRVVLGSPYPDFTWGMTNQFKYRDFDLSFVLQGQVGGQVLNNEGRSTEVRERNRKYNQPGRWLDENHWGDGKTPYRDNGIDWVLTDYEIEDADFLALRDLTIGYNLPRKLARRMGLSSMRIYATGQNLLYLMADNYRGINPEARNGLRSAMTKNAYQKGVYPIVKSYNLGININF
ncbi:TonB-dependent receptor [uncultured Bacteroides sp.]|uniref:SusC/RagA family TonB-linked outer membrane protein n=1 Tax=uncultured Bacteroides sp. TaxID=162156 RepID=UPI0025DCB67B|nr:TonB-dependent receptor [uncultured Bacteroides sp.]